MAAALVCHLHTLTSAIGLGVHNFDLNPEGRPIEERLKNGRKAKPGEKQKTKKELKKETMGKTKEEK